jgi:hypothetical protein
MAYCPFAKYSDIFGKPNEGAHKERFLGIASIDLFGTILISVIISVFLYLLTKKNAMNIFLGTFGILILLAIILHRLFCVNTTINKLIFGELKSTEIQ